MVNVEGNILPDQLPESIIERLVLGGETRAGHFRYEIWGLGIAVYSSSSDSEGTGPIAFYNFQGQFDAAREKK
jgi:hypothetical protein